MTRKAERSDKEWENSLTAEQFQVVRRKGTEPAFTGVYWDCHDSGTYRCVACGEALFDSEDKFDSGSGWPSFVRPAGEEAVETEEDRSHGMRRTEVVCKACGAHLGHVFNDGPAPGGARYCINSTALRLDRR